jgi:hypothetical protein
LIFFVFPGFQVITHEKPQDNQYEYQQGPEKTEDGQENAKDTGNGRVQDGFGQFGHVIFYIISMGSQPPSRYISIDFHHDLSYNVDNNMYRTLDNFFHLRRI